MRILTVKTSSMGDVLRTLPALADAQQAIPGIQFDWVVEEGFAQIPSWYSTVGRVIPVAIRRWCKAWFSASIKAERKVFHDAVRLQHYDAIIDAQGLVKSAALVTRLVRDAKHGMDWSTAHEPLASLFYNRKHYTAKQQHAVERTRELFAKSLGYAKPRLQGDYATAQHFVRQQTSNSQPYVVSLHATTRDDKYWIGARWRDLITLIPKTGIRIKLSWGVAHKEERARRIAEGFDNADVLLRMSLEEIARIPAGAKFIVSVDIGLSHLTAAFNRPNVMLYGPIDPGLIGGYDKSQLTCIAPEGKLSLLTVQQVLTHLPSDI